MRLLLGVATNCDFRVDGTIGTNLVVSSISSLTGECSIESSLRLLTFECARAVCTSKGSGYITRLSG